MAWREVMLRGEFVATRQLVNFSDRNVVDIAFRADVAKMNGLNEIAIPLGQVVVRRSLPVLGERVMHNDIFAFIAHVILGPGPAIAMSTLQFEKCERVFTSDRIGKVIVGRENDGVSGQVFRKNEGQVRLAGAGRPADKPESFHCYFPILQKRSM